MHFFLTPSLSSYSPTESLYLVFTADPQSLKCSGMQFLRQIELTAKGAEGSDPQAENNLVSKGTSEVSHELSLLEPSASADSHLVQRALGEDEWL